MSARFIVADVFEGLATLENDSIDLVVTSPPFLALRSYLPADHPDKSKEIGSEATPAEFIDTLLMVTAELRRVLAPHGSICVELGDTYAGSGGGGGDYLENGWREGQQQFAGSAASMRESNAAHWRQKNQDKDAWPLAKSRALIPQLYEIALAYGINPLTGTESPAGQWRIRNVVTWARPNPPVGALGDKWRPATSDLIVACTSGKRYWDDLATRKPISAWTQNYADRYPISDRAMQPEAQQSMGRNAARTAGDGLTQQGAPLLDYWEIPPGGYKGSHYAVFPEELVVPCVKAMCPEKVCRTCGEPSRRIVENNGIGESKRRTESTTLGWTDCDCLCPVCGYPDHNDADPANTCTGKWRPGIVLDPFAGSGTTLAVATGHGHDAIGIDLDARNADLAMERVGPFLLEVV